jgi:hypothetical protein
MMYCWQMFDADTDEWNILAAQLGVMPSTPMITTRYEVAERMRPIAAHHETSTGCQVRLVRFMTMEILP